MNQHLQTTLLGLSISLLLLGSVVSADTQTPQNADIEYKGYLDAPIDPEGQKYHRFLQFPAPQGASYNTRMKATANVDNTPEKETIVLMVAEAGEEWRDWCQAFLLIVGAETEGAVPKKKELFKLFGTGSYDFDVPGKTVGVYRAPFFSQNMQRGESWGFKGVSFELIDLTGDGVLDIWVEHAYGVAVISFQNGEFKKVCSGYSSTRSENPVEYVDWDNDGIYEIKIPDCISMDGAPGAAYLQWMSFFEWDGTTYILNNERFYTENHDFFIGLLEAYNFWQRYAIQEVYHFYIGLVHYYRSNAVMARAYLQWVIEHAEDENYIQAAESILKKLPPR
ncbi:MAG: hypothetical protein OXI63_13030 [Candidatus Poribacteria bacterium]|nr:hypothetical protein [Candidatus Poribacteria bacterium]